MRNVTCSILMAFVFCSVAQAQSVLFDFDNAPLLSPLPINLTVGGITANFTATGQGYSIQQAGAGIHACRILGLLRLSQQHIHRRLARRFLQNFDRFFNFVFAGGIRQRHLSPNAGHRLHERQRNRHEHDDRLATWNMAIGDAEP